MTSNEFIFSNKPVHRITRHCVFWLVFITHFAVQNILIGGFKEAERVRTFSELLTYLAFFVPFIIFTAYFFMYFVLPRFLFNRHIPAFVFSIVMILLVNIMVANYEGILYIHYAWKMPYNQITLNTNKFQILVNGFWIPVIVMGITGGIRTTKKWVVQQKENEILEKERISKELKLLKTQIHPRFLFHSLASLEENLKNKMSESPVNILKLADLLSYILYESDNETVLLDKELEVLRQYMELQENNYSMPLGVILNIDIDTDHTHIAPLILFPFLESSFEYFSLNNTGREYMKVNISAREAGLHFNLSCTGTNIYLSENAADPVWGDIKKRLQSLYPNNHSLFITTTSSDFVLDLQLNMAKTKIFHSDSVYRLNAMYEY